MRARGFTFVEMTLVVSVLGILAIGTMRFLTDASDGFVTTHSRALLASDVQTTLAVLGRDVRGALPNSLRVSASGACVEYIPVQRAATYFAAPIGFSDTRVWTVPVAGYAPGANTRLAIYPTPNAYVLGSVAEVSPPIVATSLEADGRWRIDLSAAHEFTQGSPTERLYFVDAPHSVCADGGALWQYRNYGFAALQPEPAGLPGALPNRELMAAALALPSPVFSYAAPSLNRNGLLRVSLGLAGGGDDIAMTQHLNVRNLP